MRVKNWEKFQHYKERNPPWIKLHRALLDDAEWHALDGESWKLLSMCWMLAAENAGELPDNKALAWRLRVPLAWVEEHISKLASWLLADCEHDASNSLATCSGNGSNLLSQRQRRGETETDAPPPAPPGAPSMEPATPQGPPPKTYALDLGDGMRVTQEDMAKWQQAFPNVDVIGELMGARGWLKGRGKEWFHAAAGLLAKHNRTLPILREAAIEAEKAKARPKTNMVD